MVLTKDMSVGQVAAENPASIVVFEKYGIDYCCGGNRPIEDVLHERGIPLERLTAELGAAAADGGEPAEQDWASASLAELIHHIVGKHHAYLKNELPLLERMVAKVIDTHGARHGNSLLPLRRQFQRFQQGLTGHMRREETILFPTILTFEEAAAAGLQPPKMPFGALSNPIRMMMFEHETAGWELDEMRELTSNYTPPSDGCETYRSLLRRLSALEADMHVHIHLENNILFRRALRLESGKEDK